MDFYHFEDSSGPWKLVFIGHWMNFLQFCFLDDLKLCFFTRCLYFHHNWWKERETTVNSSNNFEGGYWGKKWQFINTVNSLDNLNIQKIELLKIKLSHKLPSKQNYLLSKTCKKSHLITRTLIALNKFVFHRLVSLRIWVIKSQL